MYKKNFAASQGPKLRKIQGRNGSNERSFGSLIITGKGGEREISHKKRVESLTELISMRVERRRKVRELMAKRAGTFDKSISKLQGNF